jgi:hypothetical protein
MFQEFFGKIERFVRELVLAKANLKEQEDLDSQTNGGSRMLQTVLQMSLPGIRYLGTATKNV